MNTSLVVWDVDRVWYRDISTTYAAKGSSQDPKPYLLRLVTENKWFKPDGVDTWQAVTGRPINTVGDVADMLTDFMYRREFRDTVYAGISDQEVKNRTIEGKQMLLRGLTIGDIKRIADCVPYTDGFKETVQAIREVGIPQIGFSDGLGIFVAYKMIQNGVGRGGIVPAIVERGSNGAEDRVDETTAHIALWDDDVRLTGKVEPFKKGDAIFRYLDSFGYPINEVAAVDDSAANLSTLEKIRNNDGVAVGFNVNDKAKFEASGVPVIRGDNLFPFAEIVRDRRKIRELCETWGLEV